MSLLDDYNTRYKDATLKDKITAAIAKVAYGIFSEDPGTVNHVNRLIWAKRMLTGATAAQQESDGFMWPAVTSGAVTSLSDDSVIQAFVGGLVNYYATGE